LGQIQLSAFPLVFGGRSIYGSLAGTAIDTEDALAFSALENIRPMIEIAPLEQTADAYDRMMQGKARFRMVPSTARLFDICIEVTYLDIKIPMMRTNKRLSLQRDPTVALDFPGFL
jgi:hypothetical protein